MKLLPSPGRALVTSSRLEKPGSAPGPKAERMIWRCTRRNSSEIRVRVRDQSTMPARSKDTASIDAGPCRSNGSAARVGGTVCQVAPVSRAGGVAAEARPPHPTDQAGSRPSDRCREAGPSRTRADADGRGRVRPWFRRRGPAHSGRWTVVARTRTISSGCCGRRRHFCSRAPIPRSPLGLTKKLCRRVVQARRIATSVLLRVRSDGMPWVST